MMHCCNKQVQLFTGGSCCLAAAVRTDVRSRVGSNATDGRSFVRFKVPDLLLGFVFRDAVGLLDLAQ
jgi:hypothetical protein